MSLYNEDLVNSKIISNELNKINIKKVLESRVDIIKNTDTILNPKPIVTIYALDNYICKCISEHNINQYVKDYCKIINEQLINTPYLIYDLPIRKIDVEYLSNYIPNVKSAFVKCSLYEKEIDIINEKYEKGFSVSKSELNKLIKYLFVTANYENSSEYIKKYDKLIKEILYHESKLGFNAIGLIYKLYGYDFLRKLKLDSVTITFGNIKLDEITFGMNSNNVIIINKNIFDKINFITGSLDESDFYNYSALIGLQVVFHEITHSYQFSESKKNSYTKVNPI